MSTSRTALIQIRSIAIGSLLACAPLALFAQQGAGQMSDQQMQAMMAYAQAMQSCAANIDDASMQSRSAQMHEEMKQLCAAGKRDEAQSRAIAYGQEMAADPSMKAMQECMKKAESLKPDIPGMEAPPTDDFTQFDQSHHVCDGL